MTGTATANSGTATNARSRSTRSLRPSEWGYANFVEAITDPGHEEHDELLEWVGGAFAPDQFDVEDINKRLAAR
ncbi:hypothetical protein [Streptomyces sp. NPDC059786]|uniref:IS1096 element passenger TnpR family protein n=1 Tax=Streptomyces sp. NPDC059786 TaxID=3346946 RepID=UPI0036604B83